jgi:hypothetical protein
VYSWWLYRRVGEGKTFSEEKNVCAATTAKSEKPKKKKKKKKKRHAQNDVKNDLP